MNIVLLFLRIGYMQWLGIIMNKVLPGIYFALQYVYFQLSSP